MFLGTNVYRWWETLLRDYKFSNAQSKSVILHRVYFHCRSLEENTTDLVNGKIYLLCLPVKPVHASRDLFFYKPQHPTEGGLSPTDEVAITRNHQLPLLSVLLRDVGGLPVERNKISPEVLGKKTARTLCETELENVHAGIWAAAFVEAAVELPFPVKDRLKVLALHTRYQTIATAR